MTYYTRDIQMPKTKRDGLANFVQIIINNIEKGFVQEALLQAVDLHGDVATGIYDSAMVDAKAQSAAFRELEAQHAAAKAAAAESGYAQGVAAEKARIAAALGLS